MGKARVIQAAWSAQKFPGKVTRKSYMQKLRAILKVTKVTKVTEAIKVTRGYAKKLLQPSIYAALAFDEFYSPNHPYNNSGLRSEYIYTGYYWLRITR